MIANIGRLFQSISGLPTWVKMWLMVLGTTNMLSLAFLTTGTGVWTAVAFGVIGMVNMPTMIVQGGLTRLLSFPHFVWAPLLVYIYPRLLGPHALAFSSPEYFYAFSVFAVNGISLMFDVLESYRWLIGRREILGLPAQA